MWHAPMGVTMLVGLDGSGVLELHEHQFSTLFQYFDDLIALTLVYHGQTYHTAQLN